MTRAWIFDLDGTLVDSFDDIRAALVTALADHGLAAPTREQVRDGIGAGARSLVAHVVGAAAPLVEPVLERFRVHYAAAPVVHTRLYDGIAEALDALVARGDRLAMLTNKPHALAVQIAERLFTRWPIAPLYGARDGVPLKPDPTAALAIAGELGVPPERCTFVGDSGIDVRTALAARMQLVAVTWGYRPRSELVAAGATVLVDTPAELVTSPAR